MPHDPLETGPTEFSDTFDAASHDPLDTEERQFVRGQVIGRGGMGTVREVYDPRLLRHVAVKDLEPRRRRSRGLRRFIDEARITGQLQHPNIVPVHEFGADKEGNLYLSMKLVRGRTFSEWVKDAGEQWLSPGYLGRLVEILLKVCDALSYAHSRGVLHRDIKPPNIMIGDYGEVYLLDWGVSLVFPNSATQAAVRLNRTSPDESDLASTVGTPAYISPEQARGENDTLDGRTDIWGIGGLLYFALSGGGAPNGEKSAAPAALLRASTGDIDLDRIDPRAPVQLRRICEKCLQFDRNHRYATAAEVREALEQFLQGSWSLPPIALPAGTRIVQEGDPADTAYVILSGACEVVSERGGERKVLRKLGPGDVFGETGIFGGGVRTASVDTLFQTEVLEVTRELLTEGLGLGGWMGRFVKALAERFTEVDDELREIKHSQQIKD